ncbi:hypothetical protein PG991_011348 [Apiospora marii]|uniref:Uncharacterized protein n=1 Tax=Apiospora marii TaxID=335849 RepID=A0ABR1RDY1_9PEZI
MPFSTPISTPASGDPVTQARLPTLKTMPTLRPILPGSVARLDSVNENSVCTAFEQTDTLSTYCGFICFLEADLEFSPITASSKAISGSQFRKTVKKAPIQMMARDGRHGHLYCAARSHRFGTGSRIWQG